MCLLVFCAGNNKQSGARQTLCSACRVSVCAKTCECVIVHMWMRHVTHTREQVTPLDVTLCTPDNNKNKYTH